MRSTLTGIDHRQDRFVRSDAANKCGHKPRTANKTIQDAVRLLNAVNHALGRPDGADPRSFQARVQAALDNDLDAPEALRAVRDMTQSLLIGGNDTTAAAGLAEMLALLGIEAHGASSRGTV